MPSPLIILLAEDDSADVLLVRRALAKAGMAEPVYVVQGGAEAMAYLEGVRPFEDRASNPLPGLLLLDLKMPGVDGFEVLTWVRARPELNSMFVAVLSGSEWQQDIDRAKSLGANFYINKPCDIQELTNSLARVVHLCALQIASLAEQKNSGAALELR